MTHFQSLHTSHFQILGFWRNHVASLWIRIFRKLHFLNAFPLNYGGGGHHIWHNFLSYVRVSSHYSALSVKNSLSSCSALFGDNNDSKCTGQKRGRKSASHHLLMILVEKRSILSRRTCPGVTCGDGRQNKWWLIQLQRLGRELAHAREHWFWTSGGKNGCGCVSICR